MHLNHNRRFTEAITILNSVLEQDPDYIMALSTLWTVYHNTNQFNKAMENAKLWYAAKKEDVMVDILINNYIDYGYQAAMEKIAQALIEKKDTSYVTPWQIATLYTRADNVDMALDWLEKAYLAEDPNIPHINTDPIFDNLRNTDRFKRLLDEMNLPYDK
jgi:tetratricopeptide (TPR) repeat protein